MKKIIVASAFLAASAALPALADTVVTKTVTQQVAPAPGDRMLNLRDFDLNRDGLLSTYEVGEMIFRFYDTNFNYMLDTAEYEHKAIITVVPMETNTTITYDYDNDGIADRTQATTQTFMQDTQLARFDKNKDGLSPHDFIGKDFSQVDTDHNNGVDLTEWRIAYISGTTPITTQ